LLNNTLLKLALWYLTPLFASHDPRGYAKIAKWLFTLLTSQLLTLTSQVGTGYTSPVSYSDQYTI